MTPLVIYHGNCADGFTAAWVCKRAMPDAEFYAGVYQNPPPDVTNRDVVLVDFSYKKPVMEDICWKANSVLILDHHKTAMDDLKDLEQIGGKTGTFGIRVIFDMNRSGAMIAWDYFNLGIDPPQLLKHVQDRDLWKFELPNTREIQACMFSYPYDFEVWDILMETPCEQLAIEGNAIERKHFKDIAELIKVVTREFVIGGHTVKVANLPYTLTSDAGHELAINAPFGGCYWDTPDGRVFSLRSTDIGIDVSEIAKQYGGGGHKHASGFRVPYTHELCK